MHLRLLATLSLLLLSSVAVSAETRGLADGKSQKAAVKCQKAIDQAGAKLVATKLKSIDACSTTVLTCIQVKPKDTACLQKAGAKCSKALVDAISQAEVGANAKIVKSCGTPLRLADLLASDGLGIGVQAAACYTDFGLNVCSNLTTLAQCLVATQARGAERVFAGEQPRASELIQQVLTPLPLADLPPFDGCDDCAQTPSETLGKAVTACSAATTKAARTFAGAVAKGLGGCIDKVFACVQSKPGDIKCLGKASLSCDAAVAKLVKARTKLTAGVDKRCADTGTLPFATLATDAALNLDALADDCAALGVGTLANVGDYVACLRRQHECRVADVLRTTLPRTAELVDAGLLGSAGELLDASQCPAALPSDTIRARPAARAFGSFSISRFFGMSKFYGGGSVKATKVSSSTPPSSNGIRRVAFPQGVPGRFVPGTSHIVKAVFQGFSKAARSAPGAAAAAAPPTLIVTVKRSDLVVEDHLEIPLDDVAAGDDGSFDLQIDYADAPPSCVFDLAFAVSEGTEVSDYTVVEQVSDTVPPPTATPAPAVSATPVATILPTTTRTATVGGPTATPTLGATKTATPAGTGSTPTVTATPGPAVAYALTTTDDPVPPGGFATFVLTVTNLSNSPQNTTMSFSVPNYTIYTGGYVAGSIRSVTFADVPLGGSASKLVNFQVTTGAQAPPDGTVIPLTFTDTVRGATVSRSLTTQSAAAAELKLSSAQSTVAPGKTFTYTLAYHNFQAGPLDGAELSVPIPSGATFAGADANGQPDNGVVRWSLPSIADTATGQVHVSFAAAGNARGPLLIEATMQDSGAQVLAKASATTAVYATPTIAYTLTTTDDPVAPGATSTFVLTATNLSNSPLSTTLEFRVPDFTVYTGGYTAGSLRSVSIDLAARSSQSRFLNLTVQAPPEGTLIPFTLIDTATSAVVSRVVVARAEGEAQLKLSTQEASVKPSGTFSYTLDYHNLSGANLADAELSIALPAGATFVAAEGDLTPDIDGVVHWPLNTLAGFATGQRTVTFAAGPNAKAPLLVEATLRAGTRILSQASATTIVDSTPEFAYRLTTMDDPVTPAGVATFLLTVTNLTSISQDTTLSVRVPDFTVYPGGYLGGSIRSIGFAGVASHTSQSALISLTMQSPSDGTLIPFIFTDTARGTTVARTIQVQSAGAAQLKLSTTQATVAPGQGFAYTLSYHNLRAGPVNGVELSIPVPTGATFVSAEDNVTPGSDGVVRWTLGTLAGNASGQRTVRFEAAADALASLLLEATLRDGSANILAQADTTIAVESSPELSYTLTTTDDDPIIPGGVATFLLTATNLTNSPRDTTLDFRVPDFTTFTGGYTAGSIRSITFNDIALGSSRSALLTFFIGTPGNGTLIPFSVTDSARSATVSRTIVVQSAGATQLKLSTTQATVKPGEAFAYSLAYHNLRPSSLANVELSVAVPAGATFVSADDGVTPGTDGIVRWPLGTLSGNASGQKTINLSAEATSNGQLLVEASLRQDVDHLLGQASAKTVVDENPSFSYTLTTPNDPIGPGQVATFTVNATNLTNTPQDTTLSFRVPDFTVYTGGYQAGAVRSVTLSQVAALTTKSATINLTVTSGAAAPGNGTLIGLTATDGARGASVSRTIVVN